MVQRQVLASTLRLAFAGVALGTVAAILVSKVIAALLLATSPWDLPTYVGMTLVLLLVAGLSGYIPARRASCIDPVEALRSS